MIDTLSLIALKGNIEQAFKSLIKSGRPDIRDEQNNDLIPQLYVDLYDDNYILRQVLDDNHVVLKGRKGTGKSTIFLQAENEIKKYKDKICVYINLQSHDIWCQVQNIRTY
jgi:predicted AAA+ superfamily ATPase